MAKVLVTLNSKQLLKVDSLKRECFTSRSQIVRDLIRLYLDEYAEVVQQVNRIVKKKSPVLSSNVRHNESGEK